MLQPEAYGITQEKYQDHNMEKSEGSLQKFISEVKNKGLIKQNSFELIITLPSKIAGKVTNNLHLKAFSANTPSFNFRTEDEELVESDSRRKFIYDYDKGELNVQFYVDRKYDTVSVFNDWKNLILDQTKSKVRAISYYDDYVTNNVQLRILDNKGEVVATYVFDEVFPKSFSEIQYDWNLKSTYAIFTVTFAYKKVFLKTESTDDTTPGPDAGENNINSNNSSDFDIGTFFGISGGGFGGSSQSGLNTLPLQSVIENIPGRNPISGISEISSGLSDKAVLIKNVDDFLAKGVGSGNSAITKLVDLSSSSSNTTPADSPSRMKTIMKDIGDLMNSVGDTISTAASPALEALKPVGDTYKEIADSLPSFDDLNEATVILAQAASDVISTANDIQTTINDAFPGTVDFNKEINKAREVQRTSEALGTAFESAEIVTKGIQSDNPTEVKKGARAAVGGVRSAIEGLKGLKGLF